MAFYAGNILVTSVQLKPREIVVEFFWFPIFESMTPLTNDLIALIELPVMNIVVTILTISFQGIKLLIDNTSTIIFEMAFFARRRSVFPFKGK